MTDTQGGPEPVQPGPSRQVRLTAQAVPAQAVPQGLLGNGLHAQATPEEEFPRPVQTQERRPTKEEEALQKEPDYLERMLGRARSSQEAVAEIPIYFGENPEPFLVFHIKPLTEMEMRADYNTATRWRAASRETNYQRVAQETNDAMFKGLVIYRATIPEERKRYWDNRELQAAYGVVSAWEVIHHVLRPGGVLQAFNIINKVNGFKDEMELEDLLPNSSVPGA